MIDPIFKQAVIDHFIANYKQTNNPEAFAAMRKGEIDALFRVLDRADPEVRPVDNRPDSDHTRDVQLELDRLNRKD